MDQISVRGIMMSVEAAKCVEETGADVWQDVSDLRDGTHTEKTLLSYCLDGADADRVVGWIDYVKAIVAASEARGAL